MPEVTNPHDVAQWVPALGATVEPGEAVDAPAQVAKSLVAQGWGSAKKTSKKTDDTDEKES